MAEEPAPYNQMGAVKQLLVDLATWLTVVGVMALTLWLLLGTPGQRW